jgi:thymidylate synthase
MVELLHQSIEFGVKTTNKARIAKMIEPNLPWCDDHFQERICGAPINPGVEWANWPWGNHAKDSLDENGQFNHNYMERYWPKHGILACPTEAADEYKKLRWTTQKENTWDDDDGSYPTGLRHDYGDLADLIEGLAKEPDTRQAYLPIWFPEDTLNHGGRKPCTLGYHFIMRKNHLDVTYYIRSCDYHRHLRDDIYLTILLQLHILERCKEINPEAWKEVNPGCFNMHITSLHMFEGDYTSRYKHKPRDL